MGNFSTLWSIFGKACLKRANIEILHDSVGISMETYWDAYKGMTLQRLARYAIFSQSYDMRAIEKALLVGTAVVTNVSRIRTYDKVKILLLCVYKSF